MERPLAGRESRLRQPGEDRLAHVALDLFPPGIDEAPLLNDHRHESAHLTGAAWAGVRKRAADMDHQALPGTRADSSRICALTPAATAGAGLTCFHAGRFPENPVIHTPGRTCPR